MIYEALLFRTRCRFQVVEDPDASVAGLSRGKISACVFHDCLFLIADIRVLNLRLAKGKPFILERVTATNQVSATMVNGMAYFSTKW